MVLPEGLRALRSGAFNGAWALRDVVLPDSLEEVDGFYSNSSLSNLDFGTRIRSFAPYWMMGSGIEHLVVRGGQGAAYFDSFNETGMVRETAYFGPGVTSVTLENEPPRTIVVPADLASLVLAPWAITEAPVVYAPAGTPGWAAAASGLSEAGLDAGALRPYTPLAVTVTVTEGRSAVATGAGGVVEDAAYEYRFTQVDAESTRTVLRDWALEHTTDLALQPGAALLAEVRDITRLTAAATWTPAGSAPVVVSAPADVSVVVGKDARFTATASGEPAPTVQWQSRVGDGEWTDLAGATGGELVVSAAGLELSGREYRAVFTNDAGAAASAAATLTVNTAEPGGGEEPGSAGEQPTEPAAAPDLTSENRGEVVVNALGGGRYRAVLPGSFAGRWIGLTLHTDPVFLGWVAADVTASVTFTLPAGMTGPQRVSFVDSEGVLIGWGDVHGGATGGGSGAGSGSAEPDDVTEQSGAGGVTGPGSGSGSGPLGVAALPSTGSSPGRLIGGVLVALAAVSAGLALVLRIGRTRPGSAR